MCSPLQESRPHSGPLCGLLFLHDGAMLVTCGFDGTAVLHDVAAGCRPLRILLAPAPGSPHAGMRGAPPRHADHQASLQARVCAAFSSSGRLALAQPGTHRGPQDHAGAADEASTSWQQQRGRLVLLDSVSWDKLAEGLECPAHGFIS